MRRFRGANTIDRRRAGFTMIEVLIASLIMVIIVVAALSMYVKSNKTASDQQQYVQIQQDVRAAIYSLSRDVRMAGAGLRSNLLAHMLEGTDNENQGGPVYPDRLKLMGNVEEPLSLTIQSVNANLVNVTLNSYSFEQNSYPDSYYSGKVVLILPKSASACQGCAVRRVFSLTHSGPTNEGLLFPPGQQGVLPTPPGGFGDACSADDYAGGTVTFCDVYEYWLDVTGNYTGLTAGVNGYIGGGTGGVLYQTHNGVHNALAMNIEDLQIQYNGNFDGDAGGTLDGFTNWNGTWTAAQISSIRQIRLWVVGRTPTRFVSIAMGSGSSGSLYRHPAIANSPAGTTDDGRKRFVLETTSNVRSMSLNLLNTGVR